MGVGLRVSMRVGMRAVAVAVVVAMVMAMAMARLDVTCPAQVAARMRHCRFPRRLISVDQGKGGCFGSQRPKAPPHLSEGEGEGEVQVQDEGQLWAVKTWGTFAPALARLEAWHLSSLLPARTLHDRLRGVGRGSVCRLQPPAPG